MSRQRKSEYWDRRSELLHLQIAHLTFSVEGAVWRADDIVHTTCDNGFNAY